MPVSPIFSINGNAHGETESIKCLYSKLLDAYLIDYYVAFVTDPSPDGKVYVNTKLELKNPVQIDARNFDLMSQVDPGAKPLYGDAAIGKYCQDGTLWFRLAFNNSSTIGNTLVRALGQVIIPCDVSLW